MTYQNEAFSSVSFRKSLGNLPSDSVAYVYPDEQGNIWIGTDCGVVQVTGDKTILVEKRNTFAAQSFGKDIFFLSTNGIISKKEENKPSVTVAHLQKEKSALTIYGTLCLQDDWVIFTSNGGYLFNTKTNRIHRQS